MSERGRRLFDRYVTEHLRDPVLSALPVGTHVFNLTELAEITGVPITEITEEVEPLAPAIREAKRSL